MIWIEITKPTYGFTVGSVHQFCDRKGKAVIDSGCGKKTSKPKPEKPAKVERKVEVATATPNAETAEKPPVVKEKAEKTKVFGRI